MRPIHLGLLTGQGTQREKGLRRHAWTQPKQRDTAAQGDRAARVPTPAHHLEDRRRRETRIALEGRAYEGHVGIELGRSARRGVLGQDAGTAKRSVHRAVMNAEMASDRGPTPALDLEEAADLSGHVLRDHRSLSTARGLHEAGGRAGNRRERTARTARGSESRRGSALGRESVVGSSMPRPSQAAPQRGNRDASLFSIETAAGAGTKTAAQRACDGHEPSAGNDLPAHARSDDEPHRCKSASSTADHGRTTSTTPPPNRSGRTGIDGNPGAEPRPRPPMRPGLPGRGSRYWARPRTQLRPIRGTTRAATQQRRPP